MEVRPQIVGMQIYLLIDNFFQSVILTSSVEVEKLKQRNCDLEKEMELIEEKLREMTSKYENLEVSPSAFRLINV